MVDHLENPAVITYTPPPGVLLSGHFIEEYGYRGYRPNGTRDWLITYTISGEGEYYIHQDELICREGDIIILKPGTIHHYAAREESEWNFMWTHFVPHSHWMDYFQLPEPLNGLLHFHIKPTQTRNRIVKAFTTMMEDNRSMQPFREELALHSLEEIFLLINQILRKSEKSMLDQRVEKILIVLTEQMNEPHRVEDLAQMVNLSPSHLAHLFKKQTGDSILETLLKVRLRHSARLLEFTSRKIADIAHDVGFQDSFYYSRQFKAFYGVSPSTFRDRLQNQTKNNLLN